MNLMPVNELTELNLIKLFLKYGTRNELTLQGLYSFSTNQRTSRKLPLLNQHSEIIKRSSTYRTIMLWNSFPKFWTMDLQDPSKLLHQVKIFLQKKRPTHWFNFN